MDYLSVGLDPKVSTLFIQSQILELTKLSFYYMNLVNVSRFYRNPTVKMEIRLRNSEANIPAGFLCYSINQAVDITAFKATTVPAGEDQLPMLSRRRKEGQKLPRKMCFKGSHKGKIKRTPKKK